MYEVMTEPPVSAMIQEMRTLVPLMDVIGATGVVGLVAAIIDLSTELVLYPIALCAWTTKI